MDNFKVKQKIVDKYQGNTRLRDDSSSVSVIDLDSDSDYSSPSPKRSRASNGGSAGASLKKKKKRLNGDFSVVLPPGFLDPLSPGETAATASAPAVNGGQKGRNGNGNARGNETASDGQNPKQFWKAGNFDGGVGSNWESPSERRNSPFDSYLLGKDYPRDDLTFDRHRHISHAIREGLPYKPTKNCRGSAKFAKALWDKIKVLNGVQARVEQTGLHTFVDNIRGMRRTPQVLQAIRERWWDTTHTVHLHFGEATMTPTDFLAITGLECVGNPLPATGGYKPASPAEWRQLIGFVPSKIKGYAIELAPLRGQIGAYADRANAVTDRVVRGTLWYILSETIFANHSSTARIALLGILEDLDLVSTYDWGSAGLAFCYHAMDEACRHTKDTMQGYSYAWEIWGYAVFSLHKFELSERGPQFPDIRRWSHSNRTVDEEEGEDWTLTVEEARALLNGFSFEQQGLYPWTLLENEVHGAWAVTDTQRILVSLEGAIMYLGERVFPQHGRGSLIRRVPEDPPREMHPTFSVTATTYVNYVNGYEAENCVVRGASYEKFMPRLMGPLVVGGRKPRARAFTFVPGSGSSAPCSSSQYAGPVPFVPDYGPPSYSYMMGGMQMMGSIPIPDQIPDGYRRPPNASSITMFAADYDRGASRMAGLMALVSDLSEKLFYMAASTIASTVTPICGAKRSRKDGSPGAGDDGGAGSSGDMIA